MSVASWFVWPDTEVMATTLTPSSHTETLESPAPHRTDLDVEVKRSTKVAEPVSSTPRPPMTSWWSDLFRRPSSDFGSPRDAVLFTADVGHTVRSIQR